MTNKLIMSNKLSMTKLFHALLCINITYNITKVCGFQYIENSITGPTGMSNELNSMGFSNTGSTGLLMDNISQESIDRLTKILRGRILTLHDNTIIPINGICPGDCMTFMNKSNTQKCTIKKCYEWNKETKACYKTGKSQTIALILQIIPITGIFGSGFGNIERWDLFTITMSVVFGGCFMGTCLACCTNIYILNNDNDDLSNKNLLMKCFTSCYNCTYLLVVMGLYIWGIFLISSKLVLDGNGCELV